MLLSEMGGETSVGWAAAGPLLSWHCGFSLGLLRLVPTSLLSLQGACPLESTASPSSSCFLVRAQLEWLLGTMAWEGGPHRWSSQMPVPALFPATAPTSFEGPFGRIVHQVRATIDTARFSKGHKCSLVFYILSPLNLNSIPDIEVRVEQWSPWCPAVQVGGRTEGLGVPPLY